MPRRALTSMLLVLLLALVPATAFADGAGDEQYQDPLAAPTAPKKPKKQATTTAPASTTPAATTAPATASAPASTSASSSASATTKELPRTGFPAGAIGLAGVTLIASGAALRRRTVAQ